MLETSVYVKIYCPECGDRAEDIPQRTGVPPTRLLSISAQLGAC